MGGEFQAEQYYAKLSWLMLSYLSKPMFVLLFILSVKLSGNYRAGLRLASLISTTAVD
jgi:hypothetical protein